MPSHVALLYSVVLGPGRRVVMSDLKAMAEGLGLRSVATLVATGNLVFDSGSGSAELESRLETAFAARFGKPVDIIVRDAARWRALVAANPFPAEAAADAGRVVVRVMRHGADPDAAARLAGLAGQTERVALVDGDLWVAFGGQPSRSRLLSALGARRLGVGTARNWNTIRRLGAMLSTGP